MSMFSDQFCKSRKKIKKTIFKSCNLYNFTFSVSIYHVLKTIQKLLEACKKQIARVLSTYHKVENLSV